MQAMENADSANLLPVEVITAERCRPHRTSSGFLTASKQEMIREGKTTIPITIPVQSKAGDRTVQPRRSRSESASGTRLRLRLSNIFQRDNPESGFPDKCPPGPVTNGRSHRTSCQ